MSVNSDTLHCTTINTHTRLHTHPFNGPFSRTTRVGRYQKGKTNLDFTEARDSEWQWHQLGLCKSAPHSRQITTPAAHHSVFYRPDALPAAQPTASKHWRHTINTTINRKQKIYVKLKSSETAKRHYLVPNVLAECLSRALSVCWHGSIIGKPVHICRCPEQTICQRCLIAVR